MFVFAVPVPVPEPGGGFLVSFLEVALVVVGTGSTMLTT